MSTFTQININPRPFGKRSFWKKAVAEFLMNMNYGDILWVFDLTTKTAKRYKCERVEYL